MTRVLDAAEHRDASRRQAAPWPEIHLFGQKPAASIKNGAFGRDGREFAGVSGCAATNLPISATHVSQ